MYLFFEEWFYVFLDCGEALFLLTLWLLRVYMYIACQRVKLCLALLWRSKEKSKKRSKEIKGKQNLKCDESICEKYVLFKFLKWFCIIGTLIQKYTIINTLH